MNFFYKFLICFVATGIYTHRAKAKSCEEVLARTAPYRAFGAEVELRAPEKMDNPEYMELVSAALKKKGYKVFKPKNLTRDLVGNEADYKLSIKKNGKVYDFFIEREYDLEMNPSLVEFRTGIFKTEDDFQALIDFTKASEEVGLYADTELGGIHFHIEADKDDKASLKRLVSKYKEKETTLYETFAVDSFREHKAARRWSANDESYDPELGISRPKDRTLGLNLLALKKFGTVEFRLFNASTDETYIRSAFLQTQNMVRASFGDFYSISPPTLEGASRPDAKRGTKEPGLKDSPGASAPERAPLVPAFAQ